jgi:antitoxin (DNA-binding transcriptional repressor) of toxin-antitoxin stability system
MKTLTVKELQENFEYYLDKVEAGESFLINSKYGDAMLVPYNSGKEEVDDLIRIHTDHEEGC